MRKRRDLSLYSISFLDLLSGALGAVIILYVAIPKNKTAVELPKTDLEKELLQSELKTTKKDIAALQEQLKQTSSELAAIKAKPVVETPPRKDLDIGFKFKGKKVVFVIDTSYSMTEEDRMGQVKAGLKMLLTSFSPGFEVDIVQYPFGTRAPFKSLWGRTRETSGFHKNEAFGFIYSLRPNGGTPTRDALLFVLKNYPDISDIVLLSDGAPSLHNSNQKDNIHDILTNVRHENHRDIQINAIGVGSNFVLDKSSTEYRFLSLLAEQNKGFFVGF